VSHHAEKWSKAEEDAQYQTKEIEDLMAKYQHPEEADKMNKIKREIDEVTDVMQRNIESLLERGQKIDDVIAKSDDLSGHSKGFLRQAKEQNSCRRRCV